MVSQAQARVDSNAKQSEDRPETSTNIRGFPARARGSEGRSTRDVNVGNRDNSSPSRDNTTLIRENTGPRDNHIISRTERENVTRENTGSRRDHAITRPNDAITRPNDGRTDDSPSSVISHNFTSNPRIGLDPSKRGSAPRPFGKVTTFGEAKSDISQKTQESEREVTKKEARSKHEKDNLESAEPHPNIPNTIGILFIFILMKQIIINSEKDYLPF